MFVRLWRGRVPTEKAAAYRAFLNARAIPDYRSVAGNLGVYILERREDVEQVKYYPEDQDFLLGFEPRAVHYEVVGMASRTLPEE